MRVIFPTSLTGASRCCPDRLIHPIGNLIHLYFLSLAIAQRPVKERDHVFQLMLLRHLTSALQVIANAYGQISDAILATPTKDDHHQLDPSPNYPYILEITSTIPNQ